MGEYSIVMQSISRRKNKYVVTLLWLSAFLCFFGLFFESTVLKNGVINNNILRTYSILPYIGILLIAIADNAGPRDLYKKKYDDVGVLLYFLLLLISVIALTYMGAWDNKFGYFISIILPSIIIVYRFRQKKNFEDVFDLFVNFLAVACCLMLFTEILDIFTNMSISKWIANFSGIESLIKQSTNYARCVTYLGHPLTSAELLLFFYLFYHISCKLKQRHESFIPAIMALLGIALTQSRTALVLFLVCFLIFNFNNKRIRYIIIILLFIAVAYAFGIFDLVIARFTNGITSGDISSGRNTTLINLISTGQLRFYLLRAQTIMETGAQSRFAVALEYPILRWAFNFGVLIAIPLVLIAFIYPFIIVVRRGNKDIIISLIAIMLEVNSYSGIGDTGIRAFTYYVACVLIINAAIYIDSGKLSKD